MKHETDSIQDAFISIHHVGVARGGLEGQRRLFGQKTSHDHGGPSHDEPEPVPWRHHQAIANPHQCQAQDDQPRGHEFRGMMFHGLDGVDSNIDRCLAASLNAQHPLIQRDVDPF